MKRVFITALFLLLCTGVFLPVQAEKATVNNISKTSVVSNGLYFQIYEVIIKPKSISITVQAKNKSILSQAVYLELIDSKGNIYKADDKEAINFFKPLKFNKPVTKKISFTVPTTTQNYWLAVYNKDIFKKNKKQIITKISLNEAKRELNTK